MSALPCRLSRVASLTSTVGGSYLYHYGLLQRLVRPTRQRPSLSSAAVSTRRCALSNICHHLSFAPFALTESQPGCYCCRGSCQSTTPLYHKCAAHLIAYRSAETPGCRSRHDCEHISHTLLSLKRRVCLYPATELCLHVPCCDSCARSAYCYLCSLRQHGRKSTFGQRIYADRLPMLQAFNKITPVSLLFIMSIFLTIMFCDLSSLGLL